MMDPIKQGRKEADAKRKRSKREGQTEEQRTLQREKARLRMQRKRYLHSLKAFIVLKV